MAVAGWQDAAPCVAGTAVAPLFAVIPAAEAAAAQASAAAAGVHVCENAGFDAGAVQAAAAGCSKFPY